MFELPRLPLLLAALLLAAACAPSGPSAPATGTPAEGGPSPSLSPTPSPTPTPTPSPTGTAGPSGDSAAAAQLQPSAEASDSPRATATVDRGSKVIYLTFDDGPIVPYTQQVLDVLADNDATATFFVVGAMVARNPQLIATITEAGHAIGNHTWSHTAMTTLSDAQIRSELTRTTDAVGEENMGACMRPPYGDRNERTIAVSRQQGYKTVVWTHWARDWEQPPVPELVASLKAASEDRANILLHDGGGDRPNTVAALKIMLPKWRKQGFTFAAVPACTRPLT